MKGLLLLLFILGSMTFAFAETSIQVNQVLKEEVLKKFLLEANNPISSIGARVAQINIDTTDGRNPNGTISLPIKKEDLQIALLSSEQILNPWHYAVKNDKGNICSGTDNSAEFLILLSSHIGVHLAVEFLSYSFTVSASQIVSAKSKDGSEIANCEAIAEDSCGVYIKLPTQNLVEEILEVNICKK